MRRLFLLTACILALGCTSLAHADTLSGVYNLTDAYVDGYQVLGSITFNGTGSATAANFTLEDPHFGNPVFDLVTLSGTTSRNLSDTLVFGSYLGTGILNLTFTSIADAFGNYDLCIGTAQCGTRSGVFDPSTLLVYPGVNGTRGLGVTDFSSGYLSQVNVSATPEPSSLILLATGLFGFFVVTRRRFRLS